MKHTGVKQKQMLNNKLGTKNRPPVKLLRTFYAHFTHILRRGENRSTRGKTSRSREENQQQTQPTYDAGSGNRTRDTLVGGERSHHCTIPAPPIKSYHFRLL